MVLYKKFFYLDNFKKQPVIVRNLLKESSFSYQFPLSFGQPLMQFTKGGSRKKLGVFAFSYDFYTWLDNYLASVNTGYHVEFILNSTSYKVEYLVHSDGTKVLVLDLGFSHVVNVILPVDTFVSIEKRKLLVFSNNLWWLTNFVCFFQNLRYPNAYTSKGILLKGQDFSLKPGKRRQ
jgi:ribosomal protein L6P/L9E